MSDVSGILRVHQLCIRNITFPEENNPCRTGNMLFFLSVIKCIRNSGCAPTFLSGNQLMVTWCPLSLVKYPFASQQSLFTSHATQSCLFHSVVKCWGFGFTSQASFIFIQEFLVVILFLPGTLLVLIWVSFLLFQQYPAVRMTVVYCCNAC